MDFFNQATKRDLNTLLNNASKFKLIILWGEKGNGKTYTTHSVLRENNIKTKDIIFSDENMVSFEMLGVSSSINYEDAILIEY